MGNTEKIIEDKSIADKIQEIIDKVEFEDNYTARRWLSQMKAKYRTNVKEMLPALFDAMKNKINLQNHDSLLDLPLGAFMGIFKKYNAKYNMTSNLDDFLG